MSPKRSAAPLLMLPGLICDQTVFEAQVAAFDDAIAFPGYGVADSFPNMAAAVLAVAPPRFSLLGHSMGARVALEIWRTAPERVERLALLSTGVHGVRPGEADKRHGLRDLGRRDGMAALVDAWMPPMFGTEAAHDAALVARLRAMSIRAGLAMYEAHITALLSRPELESLLPGITCPTLVAVGDEDGWSPPAQHVAIARSIPGAQLQVIVGAGHMLPAEAPETVNELVRDWLAA